jgi:hypothetical protein
VQAGFSDVFCDGLVIDIEVYFFAREYCNMLLFLRVDV